MKYYFLTFSFLIVAFGQPAWIESFGLLAAAMGYALFWNGLLLISKKKSRFWVASLWYAGVQGVQFSWLATPDYMGPFIIPFYLFLILGMGMQFGFISLFVEKSMCWHKCLAIAGGWVLCEGARLYFLCGCTWNPVGLALVGSSYSLQLTSLFGIFGLSFWVVFTNLLLLSKKKMAWAGFAVFPYLFGFVQIFVVENTIPISKTLNVALVQTDFSPDQKDLNPGLPTAYVRPLDQLGGILGLLKEVKEVDLIVLPEAALPMGAHSGTYDLSDIKRLLPEEFFPPLKDPYAIFYNGRWKVSNAFVSQVIANKYDANVIIGLEDRDLTGRYNAAFHYYPGNLPSSRYEKQILAPIGEYIPLEGLRWFAQFVGKQFGIYRSFDHGKEAKVFNAGLPIGISICLEETFSSLMRKLRVKGAQLLVSVSNDAFFPKTKLGKQHFDHGRVRAAENGAPLLRSCNSGITGGVDCFGRAIKILGSNKPATLLCSVPVRTFKTMYTLWGDGAIFCISFFSVLSFLIVLDKKKLL